MVRDAPTGIRYRAELFPDQHWWVAGRVRALDRILSSCVTRGGPALDAGAGNGLWAQQLSRRFNPVWIVEPDRRLQKEIGNRRLDRLISATLPGPLPFRDDTFTFVSCLDVLEHLEDDDEAARELGRVTRPNGSVMITVPAGQRLWSRHDVEVGHKRRYERVAVERLIARAGLVVRLLAPLNVWLYPAASMIRRLNRVGGAMPWQPANRILTAVFASEGWIAPKWPKFFRGLSWVCVAHKSR